MNRVAKIIVKSNNKKIYQGIYNYYLKYNNNIKMNNLGVYELDCSGSPILMSGYTIQILNYLKFDNRIKLINEMNLFINDELQEDCLYEFQNL